MTTVIKCLDHGFVRLVDVMGNDSSIVQAARVSYGDGTKSVREDNELINYLLRHAHTSPFEMVEFKFHCKMPIFVARQWIRHRTANVNEYSARYSEIKDEFYTPESFRVQAKDNKQGSGENTEQDFNGYLTQELNEHYFRSKQIYDTAINNQVARELARIAIPVGNYTEWYWKIDLHNLMHFLKLRLDSHAQYEIRVFAEAMATFVKQVCPVTYSAFETYRLNALTFSSKEIAWLNRVLVLGTPELKPDEFSKGEWNEFLGKVRHVIESTAVKK